MPRVLLVAFGLALGAGIGLVDRSALRAAAPFVALTVGWIGAALGARLPWRVLRRLPPAFCVLAGLGALATFAAGAIAAALLAQWVPDLQAAWQPRLPATLCLAAAVAASAPGAAVLLGRSLKLRSSHLRLLELTAVLDTVFAAAGFLIALGLGHPMGGGLMGWLVWLAVLLGSGLLTGLLFLSLTRHPVGGGGGDNELGGVVLGTVLLGSGVGYAANLSPFLVCLIASALVANFSPLKHRVAAVLFRWEHPVYAAFLVLAGALVVFPTAYLVPAALALGAVRLVAKWAAVRGAGPLARIPGLPGGAGFTLAAQGGVALAFGLNFVMAYGDASSGNAAAQAVLTTVCLIALLSHAAYLRQPWNRGSVLSPPSRSG